MSRTRGPGGGEMGSEGIGGHGNEGEAKKKNGEGEQRPVVGGGTSPSALGFAMPAEWEKHDSTWLSWPKNPLTFPPQILPTVETAYAQMVEALAQGERVEILVDDDRAEDRVSSMISTTNVRFHQFRSADVWMRDYGPIFVRRDRGSSRDGTDPLQAAVAATKWRFNAWGNKYDDLLADDETGEEVARSTGLPVFETGMVLEGGSIDTNGGGTLLTTKQCLLNKNRNPGLGQADIERLLRSFLGAVRVIWLGSGVAGDDTDGHIDDIARFVTKDTVVCMREPDQGDVNHAVLKENQELLSRTISRDGVPLEVVPIDMPRRLEAADGTGRLPASYANFYVGNSAVLVPVFQDERRDDMAVDTLSRLFHGRKVVPVDCRDLVYGFGGIHCVTQQQPSA
jgi:agmatine deiminase